MIDIFKGSYRQFVRYVEVIVSIRLVRTIGVIIHLNGVY